MREKLGGRINLEFLNNLRAELSPVVFRQYISVLKTIQKRVLRARL